MWSPNPLVLGVLGGIVIAASLVSGVTGWKLGKASGDRDLKKMYEAGQKVLADRETLIRKNLEFYREDLLVANMRKPKRVFFCPPDLLPETPGGAVSTSSGKPDNYDYGADLRAARDALVRCNALIKVVQ